MKLSPYITFFHFRNRIPPLAQLLQPNSMNHYAPHWPFHSLLFQGHFHLPAELEHCLSDLCHSFLLPAIHSIYNSILKIYQDSVIPQPKTSKGILLHLEWSDSPHLSKLIISLSSLATSYLFKDKFITKVIQLTELQYFSCNRKCKF